MKPFSKKIDLTFLILSIAIAMIGSALVAASGILLPLIYNFLETQVFHRTFDMEKWTPTMNALITFPIFFGIAFDSVFFVKFSNKSKIILLSVYFVLVVFFLVLCSALKSNAFIDSDMAADLLLGKECWRNKTFWPTSWYYSTEIRLLNMQIFSAPLFAFTSNWHIIKTVSSVLLSLLLPLSMWFVLNQLKIETFWIKGFVALLIFAPCSIREWHQVQFGSYYVTLVASTFLYAGLCFSLIYNDNSEKKEKRFKILFYLFSFLCGLSSIRYILQISFPLALVFVYCGVERILSEKRQFNIKDFFISDKKVCYSCFGFFMTVFGYVVNSVVLSRIYVFSDYSNIKFNGFNEVPIMQWLFDIFRFLGYKDKVAVFTPSGAGNVFVYVFVVFFIICAVKIIRQKDWNEQHKMFVLFSVVMFVFNAFVFINTEYYDRYIMVLVLCIFPCIAVFLSDEKIFVLNRYILGVSAAIIVLSGSFVVFSGILSSDGNVEERRIAKFLEDSNLTFGYAVFWQTSINTYLTDGKIEVASLDGTDEYHGDGAPMKLFFDRYLTPKRYYDDDYRNDEKVFLLVTKSHYDGWPKDKLFTAGKKIYNSAKYVIFEYENKKVLINNL